MRGSVGCALSISPWTKTFEWPSRGRSTDAYFLLGTFLLQWLELFVLVFVDKNPASLDVRHCLVKHKQEPWVEFSLVLQHAVNKIKPCWENSHPEPVIYSVGQQTHRNKVVCKRLHSALRDFNQTGCSKKCFIQQITAVAAKPTLY